MTHYGGGVVHTGVKVRDGGGGGGPSRAVCCVGVEGTAS